MCPITINKALLLQEGILKFELSWTAVNKIIPLSPWLAIKINPNKYSPKLDELEKYVNDCLRSVAAIIKTEKRLEDRITMLENRFELLEPELKFEEVF